MAFLAAPVLGGLTTVGGVIATGAAVAGTVLQVNAERKAAQAEQEQLRYQQEVALRNAEIEEQNRQIAMTEAALEAQDQDLSAKAELGALIASQGASGLDLGSGSFLRVRQGMETIATRDRTRIIEAGRNEAEAAADRAESFREDARNTGAAISDARKAGRVNIASSLISGVSTVASTAFKSITGTTATSNRSTPSSSIRPRLRPASLVT